MKPGIGWPIGITLLLASSVAANLVLMRVAGNDPSMAIEPDYYKRAVAFDSSMARERRSNALGWKAQASLDAIAPDASTRVHVSLLDATGEPIADATVRVVALFNARANDLQTVTLQRDADGSYSAPIVIRHPGQWELRVDATRGADHFQSSARVEAIRAAAPVESRP